MNKFETPEIKVVKFMESDVITTSSGYEQNQTSDELIGWAHNNVQGGADGDFPL